MLLLEEKRLDESEMAWRMDKSSSPTTTTTTTGNTNNHRHYKNNAWLVIFVVISQVSIVLYWTWTTTIAPSSLLSLSSLPPRESDSNLAALTLGRDCPPAAAAPAGVADDDNDDDDSDSTRAYSTPLTADGVVPNSTCDDLIAHFHRINRAFFIKEEDSSVAAPATVAPPLINYGFYAGQGFGRLVEHSTSHCLLSLSLDRPCLVDLSDRDPYYTWRSFINTGTYDWELDHKPQLKSLATSVRQAIRQLPGQGHGEWNDPVPHMDDLHLMEKLNCCKRGKTDRKKYWEHIQPWRAEHTPKALLSPNWGNAWFPNIQPPAYFGQCHRKELVSRIQNAMYQPTPLSLKLHADQRFQITRSSNEEARRRYGAIHIRFVIMQIANKITEEARFMKPFEDCLRYAKNKTGIDEWWIISDKPSKAIALVKNVSQHLQEEEAGNDDGVDNSSFKLYYAKEQEAAEVFADHSNNPTARGLFGHASMSTSVLDWMILHESQAAIVTTGAFGDTGARGHGKFPKDGTPCNDIFTLFD